MKAQYGITLPLQPGALLSKKILEGKMTLELKVALNVTPWNSMILNCQGFWGHYLHKTLASLSNQPVQKY